MSQSDAVPVSKTTHGRRWIIAVVVAIVAALYLSGRLDHALYPVGLNFNTCARNGFGATFCGSELTEYQQRIQGVQRQVNSIEQSVTTAEQSISSSESAAQQSITQAECQADPSLPGCPP